MTTLPDPQHAPASPPTPPGVGGSEPAPLVTPAQDLLPVAPGERDLLLDVLRGVALLGIFMVNMPTFTMPFLRAFGGPELVDAPTSELVAWWIVTLFFQYKFISLFSLLFGAGFALQIERAKARGRPFVGTYLRRLGVLGLIGLVHALLIWYGDILVAYAILGLLLIPFSRASGRTLLATGVAVLLFSAVLGGLFGAVQALATEWQRTSLAEEIDAGGEEDLPVEDEADAESADLAPLRGFAAMQAAQYNPADPAWEEGETTAFRDGPFQDALLFRTAIWILALLVGLVTWLWHPAALFLIGAGLMRLGFFRPESSAIRARCAWLILPALALEAVVPWATQRGGWGGDMLSMVLMGAHAPTAVLLAIGYTGLISICVDAARRGGGPMVLARFVANAGRMPLTIYLSESVLAGALMYWWGLGWFGSVDRMSSIGLVVAIWLVLAAFANLWFLRFAYGPLEWVWRVGTYGRLRAPPPATVDRPS